MSTSFERFIDIQELVDMLSKRLGLQDVSRLTCTNRKLHELCMPLLFKDLTGAWSQESYSCRLSKLFSTTAGKVAFAGNVQHIRSIVMEVDELVYYTYSLPASDDATFFTGYQSSSRPIVAMTRMTNLTQLTVSLAKSRRRPYTLPSVKKPHGGRVLAGVIAGLSRLERLSITIHYGYGDWYGLCSHIMFSCPPTLVHLSLEFFEGRSKGPVQTLNSSGGEEEDSEDESEEEVVARNRQPLINLKTLKLHGMYRRYWDSGIDRLAFAHCPNIKELDLSNAIGVDTFDDIGKDIGTDCPKIELVNCGVFDSEARQELLAFRIMNSLPAQQVTRLEYTGLSFDSNGSTVTLAVQRHSTSLREIHIKGVDDFYKISASTILKECLNLEVLYLPCDQDEGHYITLTDALEYSWNSTKLRQLTLGIGDVSYLTSMASSHISAVQVR
ncbi:hypothetical protein BGX24_011810 [Mortierella sp. AD032]|nr:hypothetical protein BGX24_011810 [Mortierella sp. AD032]